MRKLAPVVALCLSSGAAFAQETAMHADVVTDAAMFLIGGGAAMGMGVVLPSAWPTDPTMPGATSGTLGNSDLLAATVGLGLAGQIGELVGDTPVYLEWNGALTLGAGGVSSVQTYSGRGSLLLTGGSGTNGTINLTTATSGAGASASGTVSITDSSGASASITSTASSPSGGGASLSQYAYSLTTTGGVFVALTTDGDAAEAAAYGIAVDDRGYSLLGVGDLDGTTVTSSLQESLVYNNQQLLVAVPVSVTEEWTVTPKIGPVYRYLHRTASRQTIVNVDEGPAATTMPALGVVHNDALTSNYMGVLAGASLSGPLGPDWDFLIGVEAGVAGFWADYSGTRTALFPDTAGISLPGSQQSFGGAGYIGRVRGGVSHQTPSGLTLTLAGQVDFLSHAPYLENAQVNSPGATISPDETSGSLTGTPQTYYQTTLGTAGLWNIGASVSLTNRF